MTLLIRDCERIVTMDPSRGRPVLKRADILIQDRRILRVGELGEQERAAASVVVDGRGLTAVPGLIQTHVHLCQTPFRNTADDVALLEWLRQYIWPGEATLDARGLRLAALMGIGELLLGGTTTILDMATLRHTHSVFEALAESGMRAVSGKCMMDDPEVCPPELVETTDRAFEETRELIEHWHGHDEGRLGVAVTPRFAVSCTQKLLERCIATARERDLIIHTHASENLDEIALVRKKTGRGNLEYLDSLGLLSPRACLAHCVHLEDGDMDRLAASGAHVLHCPGSNLKLASGIAPVPDMLEAGLSVSLGADGAPCNNLLDMFMEMRLAALIHKPRYGPRAMPAQRVFEMATLGGARTLGLENEIGQIRAGFRADLALLDLDGPHNQAEPNVYGALVYATRADDTRHVFVDGKQLVRNGRLTFGDPLEWRAQFASHTRR